MRCWISCSLRVRSCATMVCCCRLRSWAMRLNAAASWPISLFDFTGKRVIKSPWAIRSAPRVTRFTSRVMWLAIGTMPMSATKMSPMP